MLHIISNAKNKSKHFLLRNENMGVYIKFIVVASIFITISCGYVNAQYDNEYKNFSEKFSSKIGIMIAAYNRPNYFKQVIQSLEKNPESQTIPVFFFLDSGPKATIKQNKNIINNSLIKNKITIERPYNYGIAKNLIDARRFMFDWCNFKKVLVLEDDCILSPNYIKLVLNLHQWATKNYSNVGIVTCWHPCKLALNDKIKNLAKVTETINHLWAYCLSKDTWDEMKEILYEYEQQFINKPFTASDRVKSILEWRKQKLLKFIRREKKGRIFPETIDYTKLFMSNNFATGQDGTTYFAHYMSGHISLSTIVNRALYIGKNGVHFNQAKWDNFGFGDMNLHNFTEDRHLSNFTT